MNQLLGASVPDILKDTFSYPFLYFNSWIPTFSYTSSLKKVPLSGRASSPRIVHSKAYRPPPLSPPPPPWAAALIEYKPLQIFLRVDKKFLLAHCVIFSLSTFVNSHPRLGLLWSRGGTRYRDIGARVGRPSNVLTCRENWKRRGLFFSASQALLPVEKSCHLSCYGSDTAPVFSIL